MEPNGINYFGDLRGQNLILYGNEEHYSSPNISFWHGILPLLLDNYIKCDEPSIDYEELYDKDVQPLAKIFIKAYNTILRILFYFTDTPQLRRATEEEIEEYKKRKDLLGIIANLDPQIDVQKGRAPFKFLLNYLSYHQDYEINLKDFLPKTLEKEYVRNFKGIFYLLARFTKQDEIKREIDKFKFNFSPKALKSVPKAEEFEIVKTAFARSVIIFKKSLFGIKQEQLLWDLLTTDADLVEGVMFNDCFFRGPLKTQAEKMIPRVLFKNSTFESKISFPKYIKEECNFEKCFIKGPLSFYKATIASSFRIKNCVFLEGSLLELSKTTFDDNKSNIETRYVIIRDTIFNGTLYWSESFVNSNLIMTNLAFFAPFDFKGTQFGHYCSFKNFAFAGGNYPKIEYCKEVLAEQLNKYNYTIEAVNLGLSSIPKKATLDLDAYQAALQSGWLSNKQAAYFLGISDNYLSKKRMADKKKVTRETIPSRGTGKNIRYPTDALAAFKAQDWTKLKELRKKYGTSPQKDSNLESFITL